MVFSTGRVRMADMLKSGLLFDVVGAGLLAIVCYLVVSSQ
jgi:di/tricarboxylate transporter